MFREILGSALTRVDGAHACVLMGFDGIAVASATADGADLPGDPKDLAVELAHHLSGLRKTAKDTGQGVVEETVLKTDGLASVVRVLDDHLFLMLLLAPDALVGKGRYVLRVVASQVRDQI